MGSCAMALPLQPQGPELSNWSDHCLRWFRDGTDPIAEAVLSFFDNRCSDGEAVGGAISMRVSNWDSEATTTALQKAGLMDSGGGPIALGPQRFAAYIRV